MIVLSWSGEVGAPPRGHSHAIVGYVNGRARGACGVLFRLHDNHWLDLTEVDRIPCDRCRTRLQQSAQGGEDTDAERTD